MTELAANVRHYGDNRDILRRYQFLSIREPPEEQGNPLRPLLLSPKQQAERISERKKADQQELFHA